MTALWAAACAMPLPARAEDAPVDKRFSERWFSAQSPWNQPIPEAAATLAGSDGYAAAFVAAGSTININTSVWTPAVFYAGNDLPRCTVFATGWLTRELPMHPDFARSIAHFTDRGDTDASFCIYSADKQVFYNLFNVRLGGRDVGGQRVRISAVGLYPIDGPGWWDNTKEPWTGRASGASYCGGLVRDSEYASKTIDHALSAGWPRNLVRNSNMPGNVVFPAKTTDGHGRSAKDAVPMGARLQLDPKLSEADLAALGVRAQELPLVKALQTYGAYITDSTDTVMAIYVESDRGLEAAASGLQPLPIALMDHVRFVEPPPQVALDDRLKMGQPVRSGLAAAALDDCIVK